MKEIKPRNCKLRACRAEFMPKFSNLKVQKYCCAACELDDAQNFDAPKPKAKAKPKPKPKQRKVSAIKSELWDLFSLHQKLVHSEDGEWCNCYTCDKPIQIGTIDCQGGHAFSKAANPALWFDERAVRPQCSRCNCAEEGNHYIFNERLKKEIGIPAWQDMYDGRKQIRTGGRQVYLQKIEYYTAEVERLRKAKASY